MRTRPLPNRHAYELNDLTECVQSTLNRPRNRKKRPLNEMGILRLLLKLVEEFGELVWEVGWQSLRGVLGGTTDYSRVEHEAQDVNVVILGIWMWARGKAQGEKGESSAQSSTSSRVKEWKERGGVL